MDTAQALVTSLHNSIFPKVKFGLLIASLFVIMQSAGGHFVVIMQWVPTYKKPPCIRNRCAFSCKTKDKIIKNKKQ